MRGKRRAAFKQPAADILATLSNLQILSIPFGIREEDLQGVRQLEVFYGEFVDVFSFNGFVKHQESSLKPSSFEIILHMKQSSSANIGGVPKGNRVTLEVLVFTGENAGMQWWDDEIENVVLLPPYTQELVISKCEFRPLSNNLLDAIPSLSRTKYMRKIGVHYCNGIEFLIRLRNSVSEGVLAPLELTYLEELSLYHLKGFTGLVKMELGDFLSSAGTFYHLRRLELFGCDQIKKLIPKWLLQYLLNLTEISVKWCKEMEEIIAEDDDDVILPKLIVLNLSWLPKLKSIYKGRMTCDSIQRITFRHCGNPKRLPFTLPLINGQPSAPPALEEIKMIRKEWESLEWDHPQFNNVLLLFVKH